MLVKKFIQDVIEEKNGFSFDRPHRLGESALSVVVPVIRKTNMSRDYITLVEAKDVKIEDTGLIDQVYVKNYEDKPLYISRGEIFRGKTQERASIHGYIVMPNKGIRVAVRCIHASKCINAGMEMQYGGKVPYDIRLDNQAGTWNSVSIYTSTVNGTLFERDKMTGYSSTIASHQMSTTTTGTNILSVNTDDTVYYTDANCTIYDNYMDVPCTIEPDSTDDLVRTIDNMSDSIRDAMKKIPSAENQVGIVFITENKIKGLDIYDIPVS
jgi:hypothetical protein